MVSLKDLMTSPNQSSPDGKHWEPALPETTAWLGWRIRLSDAWAVWQGKALAVRQTTKADLGIKE